MDTDSEESLSDGGEGIEIVWSEGLNAYILEDHLDEHGIWQHGKVLEVLADGEGQDKGSTGFQVNWHWHFYSPFCKARALSESGARPKYRAKAARPRSIINHNVCMLQIDSKGLNICKQPCAFKDCRGTGEGGAVGLWW
jgi:hypothetical protein